MGKTGSIDERIAVSVAMIATGRKFVNTPKMEAKGRITFNTGIDKAKLAFKDTYNSNNVKTTVQSELTFVGQELLHCDKTNKLLVNSLNVAITDFKDALTALKVHEKECGYRNAGDT
jgi:hypothetical protein